MKRTELCVHCREVFKYAFKMIDRVLHIGHPHRLAYLGKNRHTISCTPRRRDVL